MFNWNYRRCAISSIRESFQRDITSLSISAEIIVWRFLCLSLGNFQIDVDVARTLTAGNNNNNDDCARDIAGKRKARRVQCPSGSAVSFLRSSESRINQQWFAIRESQQNPTFGLQRPSIASPIDQLTSVRRAAVMARFLPRRISQEFIGSSRFDLE